MKTDMQKEKT